MVLLDSCALLWWALDSDKLSRRATEACKQMEQEGGFASAISLWELGLKVKRKKLDMGMKIREFAERLHETQIVEILPVEEEIWLANLELRWRHKDPVDRTIVATAIARDLPIVTADDRIRKYYRNVIW